LVGNSKKRSEKGLHNFQKENAPEGFQWGFQKSGARINEERDG
jgi:hypothetical protein